LRLDVPGGVYHVIARGNERKAVFRDDLDREQYLIRLADCHRRFGLSVFAHCLMDNHVHLVLERGPVSLSRIMLTLQSSYAQWFNRRHGRVGHLFQGRYKSFLVEKERYLLALLRYVHENPVKAGLVKRPQDFRWSSDRCYRSGTGPDWLVLDCALGMLAPGRAEALARYRQMMHRGAAPLYEEGAAVARAIKGSDDFALRMMRGFDEPFPRRRAWTMEDLAGKVAAASRLTVEGLKRRGQSTRPSQARAVAAYLARQEAGIPVARMARFFGRDNSTLVRGVLRLEAALLCDERLRARLREIVIDLDRESARVHA
jgi:REP element-mobilizing transposase RayT